MRRRLIDRWWWAVGAVLVSAVLATAGFLARADASHHREQVDAERGAALTGLRTSVDAVVDQEAALSHLLSATRVPLGAHWPLLAREVLNQAVAEGVGFVQPVTREGRTAFERRTGVVIVVPGRAGSYVPAPERPGYDVLRYLSQRQVTIHVGVDLSADPARRSLLARSAAADHPLASAPLPLLAVPRTRVVLVFDPVYGSGHRLEGWLSAVYLPRLIVSEVQRTTPALRVTVTDGRDVLADGGAVRSGRPTLLPVAGRTWSIWLSPAPAGASAAPWLILGLGLVLAGVVTVVLRQAATRERYATAQVERFRGAERLRQAESTRERQALAEAQTIANVGSWSLDPVTGQAEWTDEMYRIFRRDPAEGPLLGEAFVERFHRDDRRDVLRGYRAALRNGTDFELRVRVHVHEDELRHVRIVGRRDPGAHYVGTVQDVTEGTLMRHALQAANTRLQAVLDHAPMAVYLRGLDGRFLLANHEFSSLLGYEPRDLVGRGLDELVAAEMAQTARDSDRQVAETGRTLRSEEQISPVEGLVDRRYLWHKFPVRDGSGEVTGIGGIALDITERAATERALRETEERFRSAFQESPVGMVILGFDGRIIQINEALASLLGYPSAELEGSMAQLFDHGDEDDVERGRQAVRDMHAGLRTSYAAEQRFVTASGEIIDCALHAAVLNGSDGQPQAVLSQLQDITELKRQQRALEHLADHDSLTDLPNRRGFERALRDHVVRSARYGARGSVLMIDLDGFKLVNDTLGHHAGDQLLTQVAARLRERLRGSDIVGRWGGDEFVVLLPETEREEARELACELTDALLGEITGFAGPLRDVGASIGVAGFADVPGIDAEQVVARADRAMYEAKAASARYAATVDRVG